MLRNQLIIPAALFIFVSITVGQLGAANVPLTCTASGGLPPIIRAEGQAELVADVVLFCTGGTATPSGSSVPQVNLMLTFNTTITSHIAAPGFSEALLLIDEPHGGLSGGTNTILACGASGTNDNGSGGCSITSDGIVTDTYNGSAGHPNVFQGQPFSLNAFSWTGIPIDPPGQALSNDHILRFTNLRVNAALLGAPEGSSPTQVVAMITTTGPAEITINNPQQVVAYTQTSLVPKAGAAAVLSQCSSANPTIAANPTSPLDAGGQNGAQFLMTQTEGFTGALQTKNIAQAQANGTQPSTTLYPVDMNQNIPGYPYNTETGFFDGSSTDPTLTNDQPTAELPSLRGLNTAGSANSGTRIYFQFSPIPAGLQLYVPVTIPLLLSGTSTQSGIAVLTTTDANGAGPYTPAAGNLSGLAPVVVENASGTIAYEILSTNNNALESFTVPVAAAYLANQVTAGTVNVQSGLAPMSTVGHADSISPVPRFVTMGSPALAFTIQSCGTASTTTASSVAAKYSASVQSVPLAAKVTTAAGPVTGGTVTFTVSGVGASGPVAVSNGSASTSLSFTGVPAGTYGIQAAFSGSSKVAGSSDSSHSLTIAQSQVSITWPTPADLLVGTPLGTQQLNASAGIPGQLVYKPPAGTALAVGNGQKLGVTFTPTDAVDYAPSTQTVLINVKAPGFPFGSFDTPAASSTGSGSIGFTGWALAGLGITRVEIWREKNPNEAKTSNGMMFVGTSSIIAGARPDVKNLYPNYPGSNSAGWGFLMLTNELPSNDGTVGVGNGAYKIHALAYDSVGHTTDLGIKTIVIDNKDSASPFGAIDTPPQGGTVSGTAYVNFGWALTPQGKTIPIDGSTIWVYIDRIPFGHPVYNNDRIDIATLFPGYANSKGAVGYYYIDTTQFANGLHTISWSVTDSSGVTSGIGSRYFIVQN